MAIAGDVAIAGIAARGWIATRDTLGSGDPVASITPPSAIGSTDARDTTNRPLSLAVMVAPKGQRAFVAWVAPNGGCDSARFRRSCARVRPVGTLRVWELDATSGGTSQPTPVDNTTFAPALAPVTHGKVSNDPAATSASTPGWTEDGLILSWVNGHDAGRGLRFRLLDDMSVSAARRKATARSVYSQNQGVGTAADSAMIRNPRMPGAIRAAVGCRSALLLRPSLSKPALNLMSRETC